MNLAEWPLRFTPRRPPPFLAALAVAAISMGLAIGLRLAFLGLHNGFGLSSTFFPAFILTTLYAGRRWGLATLAVGVGFGVFARDVTPFAMSNPAITLMFAASGAVCVLVSGALRETLLNLEAAREEQQRIRDALAESEQRLELAQEAGSVGLWDLDLATGEGHWSPVLYRNVGLNPRQGADLKGLLAVVHPDDRELVRRTNKRAMLDGVMEPVEYRVTWPDGSVHWLLSRGDMLPAADGSLVRAVGVNIDVTERRRADEQVRESEARFRALANRVPVLMWVSRPGGVREFVNQAYLDFLGGAYEAALAFDWRDRLDPEDRERVLAQQVEGETSRQAFVLEARFFRFDGEPRWLRAYSQPRLAPGGGFEGFIGIAIDVTEAKQAEADLMRINELLAERVQAAVAERDQAAAALARAQKLEAVGQLTGGVAHDFNNLLMVVTGALDQIRRHPHDDARRERMLEAAQGAARRGERLTHQLLAFSRRQALKPELTRIDDLLTEAGSLLRRAVDEGVSFTLDLGAPDTVGRIDPAQFEAAVLNLVVNARDAVGQSGAIGLETAVVRLEAGEVEETPAGAYICVTVRDTGCGMDDKTLARVFEPFFTTKEVGKGTGLGLSQVYGFARQSGGGATVESAPGRGTAVRIYLPLSPETLATPKDPPPLAAGKRSPRLNVLLVEDDVEVGDMVEAMLEGLGHTVERAQTSAAALDILRRASGVDLLLTDLVMPGGKTGVELAHEAAALRPELPVILSSGYVGEALVSAEGAPWPMLRKPYTAEALARAIADVSAIAPQTA
ncbi:PAS domain S-box protein [Phenylobacterium sp.]|jgi:PAS domain S-box-containing protein|uniref:hybrid sensor histidine kinase/response regulator n=1 Tax=Phenylobacterium sp. TaxID=1871053 RepID=UPI002F3ECF56